LNTQSQQAGNGNVDEILARLSAEFIDDTADRLNELESQLDSWSSGQGGDHDLLALIRREAHSIKGMGGSFGYPSISVIGHRLEDYLTGLDAFTEDHVRNVLRYLDGVRRIAEEGDNGQLPEDMAAKLPTRLSAEMNITTGEQPGMVDILVGIQSGVQRMALEKEMYELGYRVVASKSGIEVLQLAVTMRPSAVIVSNVMDDLWGQDIVRALAAMEATRHIPVALLTSFEDSKLADIPEETVIIHKDAAHLAEGLAELASRIKVKKAGTTA